MYSCLVIVTSKELLMPDKTLSEANADNTEPYPVMRIKRSRRFGSLRFHILYVDPASESVPRLVSTAIAKIQPNATFSIGFGNSVDAANEKTLKLCTELLVAKPNISPLTKAENIKLHRRQYHSLLEQRVIQHLYSEDWFARYATCGYNDVPTGEPACALVHCDIVSPFVSDLIREYSEVSVTAPHRRLFDVIDNFKELNVHSLLAPQSTNGYNERDKKICSDHLMTYVISFCMKDFENTEIFSKHPSLQQVSTGKLKVRFHRDKDKQKWNTVKKEAIAVWTQIRKYLIDGVLKGIDIFPGSVLFVGQFTNRDRALLLTLYHTGLLQIIVGRSCGIESCEFECQVDLLPLKFLEFLNSIHALSKSRSNRDLANFGKNWNNYQEVRPIARAIAKNKQIISLFRRCG